MQEVQVMLGNGEAKKERLDRISTRPYLLISLVQRSRRTQDFF